MPKKADQSSRDFAISLGALIKSEREKIGMTQLQLAHHLGHESSVMVCRYERGAMAPTAYVLSIIAQALNITIELNPHTKAEDYE